MKKFNIILEQDGEVTVFGEWEDTPENRQCFQEWSEMGYRETTDKYVRGYDEKFYIEGQEPEKPIETLQAEVRAVRNSYLEKYVDPKQLVMVWDSLSADDKKLYADYRQYLIDYTEQEDWYLQNPMTLDEWKQIV